MEEDQVRGNGTSDRKEIEKFLLSVQMMVMVP